MATVTGSGGHRTQGTDDSTWVDLTKYHGPAAYKQQVISVIMSHSSGGWDVQDQGASRITSEWPLPVVCSLRPHMAEGKGALWSLFCFILSETSVVEWMGELTCLKQVAGAMPHHVQRMAGRTWWPVFALKGEGR